MEFNEVASPRGGIIQNIERESKLGLGTISDNASPNFYLDFFTGKVNEAGDIIRQWIDEINDEQTSQDTNDTGSNPESKSFVDDTQIFDLDSDVTRIRKVEIHDATKTEPEGWITLDPYYQKDRIDDLYGQDSGMPSKYFLQGREIHFDIPIDITKADKYRITHDREATVFTTASTTTEPGIPRTFHWLYVYLPVMDWTEDKDLYNKLYLKVYGKDKNDENSLKYRLQSYIMNQNRDMVYKIGRNSVYE